jgi:hypothetical protein
MHIRRRRFRRRLFATLAAALFASSLLATAASASPNQANATPLISYYPIQNAWHLCLTEGVEGYAFEVTCNLSNPSQQWGIYQKIEIGQTAFYYSYMNKHTGHCLGVNNGSTAQGAWLVAGTCGGTSDTSQFWRGLLTSGPFFQPWQNLRSRWYVTPYGRSHSSGTQLEQWSYNGDPTQQWNRPGNG